MPSPSFAVVIPTYNRAERLRRTLESVAAQTLPATQVVVVDDASTDHTPNIVDAFAADHPGAVYVRHETNRDRAAARNTGLDRVETDYVTFLDSDDLMYPSNLADAADFARTTGAKFFHNLYHSVDEHGNHLRDWPRPGLSDPLRALSLGNFLGCQGVFLHRDIHSRYRFDEAPELTGSEDYELWLRVAADHPIRRLERVNSAIVEHGGRSMHNLDLEKVVRRVEYTLAKIEGDPHLAERYRSHLGRLRAGRMLFLAMSANDAFDRSASLGFLRRAVRAHPLIALSPRFIRCLQLALFRRPPRTPPGD